MAALGTRRISAVEHTASEAGRSRESPVACAEVEIAPAFADELLQHRRATHLPLLCWQQQGESLLAQVATVSRQLWQAPVHQHSRDLALTPVPSAAALRRVFIG